MSQSFKFHTSLVLQQWRLLASLIRSENSEVSVDGLSIDIPHVIYVSRYADKAKLSLSSPQTLEQSYLALQGSLSQGDVVYGVNTGFGASADTRSWQLEALQRVLTRELTYGILPPGPREPQPLPDKHTGSLGFRFDLAREDTVESLHLPRTWVRAAILLRINSLIKGRSGIRPSIIQALAALLMHDIVPMIPLRGSISASGDLNPLAYISGTIQGKTTLRVLPDPKYNSSIYADEALQKAGLNPVKLQAKEGLAIVNGTAISAACGVHVLHDAHQLAMLAQILTAMSVEALLGNPESFHPIFSESRPHPGQKEAAKNILSFLHGSRLAQVNDGTDGSMRQDRYSVRTAPQWIGPALEDLMLAHQQLVMECNSATDNPLIDQDGRSFHGGNFQAKAVTAATEKIRNIIQSLGRMMFAQCQEIINHTTSHGLSPNLVAEEPNQSGIFKAIDIYISALLSELGFLANPVNHVQNAEMGNQALNSLALISGRYTSTSVRVLTELTAAHLLSLCQALDLRAMQLCFLESCEPHTSALVDSTLMGDWPTTESSVVAQDLKGTIWTHILKSLDLTVTMESSDRFTHIARSARVSIIEHSAFKDVRQPLETLEEFVAALGPLLYDAWMTNREAYMLHGDASEHLGTASKKMYSFVRRTLGVPFLCTARILTPEPEQLKNPQGEAKGFGRRAEQAPTVGTYTSIIYRALREGKLIPVMLEIVGDI